MALDITMFTEKNAMVILDNSQRVCSLNSLGTTALGHNQSVYSLGPLILAMGPNLLLSSCWQLSVS